MKKYLVVIFVVFFLQSCEDNKVVYKPESSARINSITVVVDNDNWNNTIGDKIRNSYADEYEGLPQIEERFTLKQMPYEAIDEKTYEKEVKKLGKLSFGVIKNEEADVDKFCNNDSCEIIPMTGDNDDQDYAN